MGSQDNVNYIRSVTRRLFLTTHTNARSPEENDLGLAFSALTVLLYGPQLMSEPPHHLLLRENPGWFNLSGAGLPGCPG